VDGVAEVAGVGDADFGSRMKTMPLLRRTLRIGLCATVLMTVGLSLGPVAATAQAQIDISSYAEREKPPSFADPAGAVDAFKAALTADDIGELAKLVGLDGAKLKADENATSTFEQIRDLGTKQLTVQDVEDRKVLNLGPKLWPFPFPLVKSSDGKWAFDTKAGLEEIVNRRIGENELQTIDVMRAYVDAQREYASQDRNGDGVLEYAQKLVSTPGKTDGLYWPADQGNGDSPAGAFASEAALEKAKQGQGYFGYRYRILTGQGENVAGGRYNYIINGHMVAGFALLAWPVKYGQTGVNTFAINQAGVLYQVDLGTATESRAQSIKLFNPGADWSMVND
jgi:Protein of unknown function (DUF2950)